MSPLINGRQLGVAHNGVFTASNTAPIPGGRLWPEAALTWNAVRAEFIAEGGNPDAFMPKGSVSSIRTIAVQQHFWDNQPPTAAWPGTSHHGWGLAVDVRAGAEAWLLLNGMRFGWSHAEGERAGESWHFNYVGASKGVLRKLQRDPLAGYTPAEKRWIHEYDRLRRTGSDAARLGVLRIVMTEQRKRIFRAAQQTGWTKLRRRRYQSLRVRTT